MSEKRKKSEPDWKQFGQFISMVVSVFTVVRDTLQAMDVGFAEALAWAIGPGRKSLADEFIRPLGQRVLDARPKLVVTRVQVDLGAFPKKLGEGFSVEDHRGEGTVTLEKRSDGHLYLDGHKLVLWQSDRQKSGKTVTGYDLKAEATGQPVRNGNVLDALLKHPELFPDDWKTDEQGRTRYVFFLATIYRHGDNLCVRCACFGGGRWLGGYYWLDFEWVERYWSAVRAS
jgi:hypothetical protein